MYDDSLEQLVLSGALFNGDGGDQSPRRNRSPATSRPHSPAVTFEDDEAAASIYVAGSEHHTAPNPEDEGQESIGMGPGRTGVKGVIRDRDEHREREMEKGRKEMDELAAKQAKMDLSAATYFQDLDREGEGDKTRLEGDAWGGVEEWRQRRLLELKTSAKGGHLYGHLREVGVGGFVEAVEKVPREVWVVLHIYDPVSVPLLGFPSWEWQSFHCCGSCVGVRAFLLDGGTDVGVRPQCLGSSTGAPFVAEAAADSRNDGAEVAVSCGRHPDRRAARARGRAAPARRQRSKESN